MAWLASLSSRNYFQRGVKDKCLVIKLRNVSLYILWLLLSTCNKTFSFANKSNNILEESDNRPRSLYQYSSMAPRLSGQNCKFFKVLLSLNFQKRLGYKENNTKYRILTQKPRSHVRILIYRTWPVETIVLKNNRPLSRGGLLSPRGTKSFVFARLASH